MSSRSTTQPSSAPAIAAPGSASQGETPSFRLTSTYVYAPIMKNSPWAKFTIFSTPKIIARPTAISA